MREGGTLGAFAASRYRQVGEVVEVALAEALSSTSSFRGTVATATDMGGLVAPGESWTLIASFDDASPVTAGPGTE